METTRHKPGIFKQAHKKFKTGRHRTKGEVNRDSQGRKAAVKKPVGPGAKLVKRISRIDRLNLRKQIRQEKKEKIEVQRLQEGGSNRAPHLITIISLDLELLSTEIMEQFLKTDEEASISAGGCSSITYLNVPRFKARYGFLCPDLSKLDNVLECISMSDILMLVWPTDGEIEKEQQLFLDILLAHGLCTPMHIVSGLPSQGKQREQMRKTVIKTINKWLNFNDNLFYIDTQNDKIQILRQLCSYRKKPTLNQCRHPQIFAEKLEMESIANGSGTLQLTGYVRGAPLNVNKLVHLRGWGHYQMQKIVQVIDPRRLRENKRAMDCEHQILATAEASKQQSLQSEVVLDSMENEQALNVLNDVDETVFKIPKVKRKLPKGMSEYQAAWMVEDGDEENCDANVENNVNNMEVDKSDDSESDEEGSENFCKNERVDNSMQPYEEENDVDSEDDDMSVVSTDVQSVSISCMEEDVDTDAMQQFRDSLDDEKWPDQVTVLLEERARERFQRYRGLKSFRTSFWDPKENLPLEYARIYKFENFKQTKKIVLEDIADDYTTEKASEVALPGTYVTIYISNVPAQYVENLAPDYPVIATGMLKHEQKFSLMNVILRKYSQCQLAIKNKQTLIFHVGYRQFKVDPVFSQHSNGEKFKMERFMPSRTPFVASYFGPVTFGPTPVLVFRQDEAGRKHFVAYGVTSNPNPDRIVLKRAVMCGAAYKINKRTVVVRFMFFNKEDVNWFKPVELYTDSGNRGHIKDSIGLHGLMKCTFNLPLKKQDQIKMNLYKRVFPRWTYTPITPTSDQGLH